VSDDGAAAWIVATRETAERWQSAFAGLDPQVLPWGAVGPPEDVGAAARAVSAGAFDLVLFTSRHAPAALPAGSGTGLRCACVGAGTAAAAEERGFEVGLVGRAGGADLAARLLEAETGLRTVLHVRGAEARPEAREALEAAGVQVADVVAYAVVPLASFDARIAEGRFPRALVLGSPRAVAALYGALSRTGRTLPRDAVIIAPGETTAAAARAHWPERVEVAERNDPRALADLVRRRTRDAG